MERGAPLVAGPRAPPLLLLLAALLLAVGPAPAGAASGLLRGDPSARAASVDAATLAEGLPWVTERAEAADNAEAEGWAKRIGDARLSTPAKMLGEVVSILNDNQRTKAKVRAVEKQLDEQQTRIAALDRWAGSLQAAASLSPDESTLEPAARSDPPAGPRATKASGPDFR
jgi:hypothetical protein